MKARALKVHLVYVTAPDARTAQNLARTAVELRLAACANWIPGLRSLFRWDNRIQESGECGLLLKTASDRLPVLLQTLQAAHPYECPCVVHWELAGGNDAFIRWVIAETRPMAPARPVSPRPCKRRTPRKASAARTR